MSDNEQEMTSAEVITLSPIATPLAGNTTLSRCHHILLSLPHSLAPLTMHSSRRETNQEAAQACEEECQGKVHQEGS